MKNSIKVLGIESSCDDTAASVLSLEYNQDQYSKVSIRSSIVFDQNSIHSSFGGVVPELAARAHSEKLDFSVESALEKARISINEIDLISVTSGPGLIGGLLSGVMFSKALALGLNKPLVGVNHLAGHALTPRLIDQTPFPYLVLLVSGGHCQFLIVENESNFKRIGGTIDDAPGEAFDKTAKILGLNYPGGPEIEKRALLGNSEAYELPKPLISQNNCNMSFSGLKTALRRETEKALVYNPILSEDTINDLCASFQKTMKDIFVTKSAIAMSIFKNSYPKIPHIISLVGGVAANTEIRSSLKQLAYMFGFKTVIPPFHLCTDNAAMIAFAGSQLFLKSKESKDNLRPRPRWPLDKTAPSLIGSGKRGRKS
tara:strand:+ start:93 stop:1205 length:1113 start_codon:yes stop_codon:yes gene_type:complete